MGGEIYPGWGNILGHLPPWGKLSRGRNTVTPGFTEPTKNVNQTDGHVRKKTSLINEGQNILHNLSMETNIMGIIY